MVLGPTPIWNLECIIQWAENSVKVHRAAQVSGPEFSMSSTLIEPERQTQNCYVYVFSFSEEKK